MTKKTSVFLCVLFCLCFVFAGCGKRDDYIQKTSENISTYQINAKYNHDTKTLVANERVTFKNNTGASLDEIKFHLYPNAFRQDATYPAVDKKDFVNAYPSGASYGKIQIAKVVADKTEVTVDVGGQDDNILTVPLQKTLQNGDEVVVEMEFADSLPKVAHRYGYTDNAVCFGNWYPIVCAYDKGWKTDVYCTNGDPFCSDMANYNVTVAYPQNMTIACTGDFATTTKNDTKITTSNAKTVRDFAFVLSDKFKKETDTTDGVTVNYFYFNDDNASENLQVAVDAVDTFGNMIGKYPYKSLCVVQTDFLYGGMEYPNLVYISSTLDKTSQKQVIVHEIAHQWWYNLVGNDQVAHAWMDEGLTEFCTALFFKTNEKYKTQLTYDKLVQTAQRNYISFVDVLDSFDGGADTSMTRASNQYKTEQEYVCMTYTKGLLLFDNLAFGLGQNKMQKCLQNYFDDYKTKRAKPQDMIDSFCKTTGTNLKGFFANWLDGKVMIGNA